MDGSFWNFEKTSGMA